MMNDAKEMLEVSVLRYKDFDHGYSVGMGIHEMGTARWCDPKTSVLNAHIKCGCSQCFCTDGACMTSAHA